ncbi:MAG: lysine--tRNA ligase [Chloroflexi bacterium]|nr:lysine--tRNA ligase [Chloroflexota bacterium]
MSDKQSDLSGSRVEKLQRLRQRGVNPYPNSYRCSHTAEEAKELFARGDLTGDSVISLAGRLMARRGMGKATFLDLRDASGKIQVYLRRDVLGEETYGLVEDFDIGDFVGVTGSLFATRTGETTVNASSVTMLAKALEPLPEKWHGLADVEKRYRQRYLDLISNPSARHTFLTRTRVIAAMRRFLDSRGFIEVETPILQPVAGGARAHPFVTHHEALNEDLYLRIATELYLKRLVVGGVDRVYEIGRIFRNEGISTKHNPEFTTLESYQAYADYNDVMAMLEEMVSHIALEVKGSTKVEYGEEAIDFAPPWRRVTLRDALLAESGIDLQCCLNAGPDELRRVVDGMGVVLEETASPAYLIDKLVSTYVEPKLIQPTFLVDYPVETTPLAKRKPDNDMLVERFELFVSGMEVANAFTELNDPEEQAARFKVQEDWRIRFGDTEAERYQDDFITAMRHGMPPTGGLGVGIDRLVMLLTNQQSIREVILFPQLKTKT